MFRFGVPYDQLHVFQVQFCKFCLPQKARYFQLIKDFQGLKIALFQETVPCGNIIYSSFFRGSINMTNT